MKVCTSKVTSTVASIVVLVVIANVGGLWGCGGADST